MRFVVNDLALKTTKFCCVNLCIKCVGSGTLGVNSRERSMAE